LRMTAFLSFAPWTKEKTLSRMSPAGKSKPLLGHTFTDRYLREQVTQARGMPSKESIVRRLNFCQWVDADNPG
jgi:hypothetical protein